MFSSEEIKRICEHMNEDHHDALLLYAKVFAKHPKVQLARMEHLNAQGFELAAYDGESWQNLWIAYPKPLEAPAEIRAVLVAMVKTARSATDGGAAHASS